MRSSLHRSCLQILRNRGAISIFPELVEEGLGIPKKPGLEQAICLLNIDGFYGEMFKTRESLVHKAMN